MRGDTTFSGHFANSKGGKHEGIDITVAGNKLKHIAFL